MKKGKKMRTLILVTLLLIFGSLTASKAQETLCKEVSVSDSDKRGFDQAKPLRIDIDGDGKPDTITPRTYNVKAAQRFGRKIRESHWITFDLITSKGLKIKSFFKYNYGDNLADYWVYALLPCQIKRGGKSDLLFYAGDDTSDETVILQNRGKSFKVYSRKVDNYN